HDIEHPYDLRHRQQPRPHAGNTPATQQPAPIQWRKTPRRSRTGDARQGARAGHATTQPSASRHAHNVEHQRSPRHQHRRRPARRPRPRPPVTPTESNNLVEHTIDNDNGHTQTTQRPPTDSPTTSPNTVAKDTPAKPVG